MKLGDDYRTYCNILEKWGSLSVFVRSGHCLTHSLSVSSGQWNPLSFWESDYSLSSSKLPQELKGPGKMGWWILSLITNIFTQHEKFQKWNLGLLIHPVSLLLCHSAFLSCYLSINRQVNASKYLGNYGLVSPGVRPSQSSCDIADTECILANTCTWYKTETDFLLILHLIQKRISYILIDKWSHCFCEMQYYSEHFNLLYASSTFILVGVYSPT